MRWHRFKNQFQQGSAARDVAVLTLGTAVAQAISISITPLLTRLYSPSDFGLLAVFLAVVSVAATFITLRYESSILVPKENTESSNIVLLCLILVVGLSIILLVVSLLLPSDLRGRLGVGGLGNYLYLAFLTAAGVAVITVMQNWLNRQKKYQQMAWLRVGQSSVLAIFAIAFGILNVKDGLLFSQIITSICLCFAALYLGRYAANIWVPKQIPVTALAHKKNPKFLLPTALLDVITLQMPILLIAMSLGADEAGQFSMAWRLLMIPAALIGGAMSQVFIQRFSSSIENPRLAKKILKQSWFFLFVIGIIPFILVLTFGETIFVLVLGLDWLVAGSFAAMLAPMAFAMFVSFPTSGAYVILGLQKYSLFFGVAVFIYRPLCIYAGIVMDDLNFGIKVWVILEILQIFIYQMCAWKKIGLTK